MLSIRCIAALGLILVVGCSETSSRSASNNDSSATAAPQNSTASSDQPNADSSPKAAPVRHDEKPAETPQAQSPANPSGDRFSEEEKAFKQDSSRRAEAENMIYAQIRIKMEEMIEQRARLLREGKNPSDVEVRQLEGSIMKARELLVENGEIVEEVDPPIVQSRQ